MVHVCTCSQSKRFVAYYLKMMAYTKVFKAISNGVRQNTSDFRSWNKIGDLMIAFPSLKIQEKIADTIDNFIENIAILEEHTKTRISILEELKSRIIADTVTGRIDVRNIEIPEYEIMGEDNPVEEETDMDVYENEE